MDLAIELESEMEEGNLTNIASNTKNFYTGLYPHQIGMLLFSLLCLAPNIFLLYIICRYKLSSTIYWTMTNWSILNTLLIVNFLPLTVVPGSLITILAIEFTFYFGVALLTFTGVLVTLFMFEFFIKSEKICKYLTILIWILMVIVDVFVVIVTNEAQIGSLVISITLELIFLITILVFVAKIIKSCITPSNEESFRLRLRLCTIFLTCLFFIWITEFMAAIHVYYMFLTIIATIIIYLDGYINLIILIYCDPRIKRHFLQMFCKVDKYSDIKFDTESSTVSVVEENRE